MIIYPNPAKNEFFVYLIGGTDSYWLTLLDAMGKPIHQLMLTGNKKQRVSTQQLPSGVYYVRIENAERSMIKKLVITK